MVAVQGSCLAPSPCSHTSHGRSDALSQSRSTIRVTLTALTQDTIARDVQLNKWGDGSDFPQMWGLYSPKSIL